MASKSISLSLSHTLTLTVSNTIDNANNRSWIAWTLSVSGNSTWYDTYVKVTIDGTVRYNKTVGWDGGFPAQTGSTSGGFYVNHNSNGTRNVSMALEGYVYSYSTSSTSGTLVCTATDRSAPTVTTTVSGITHNSCTLKISSTSTIASSSGYAYQIKAGSGSYGSWIYNNNGSWTITGLSPNTTYTINGAAKKSSNNVWGYKTASFTTLGSSTLNIQNDITAITFSTSSNPSVTFEWTPLASGFGFEITGQLGSSSPRTIMSKKTVSSTTTQTQAYTFPLSTWQTDLISGTTGSLVVTLTTYNGDTSIGTSSKTLTVTFDSTIKPVLGTLSLGSSNGGLGSTVFLKGRTTLQPQVTISNLYGATVSKVEYTIESTIYQGATSSPYKAIDQSTPLGLVGGNQTISVTVTDSRGRSTSLQSSVYTVYDYNAPTGTINYSIVGNKLNVEVSWTRSSVEVNSEEKNVAANVLVRLFKNETQVGSDITLTNTILTETRNISNLTPISTVIDANSATYTIEMIVPDGVYTSASGTAISIEVTTGVICISRLGGGKGVTLFQDAQYEGFWIRDIQHDISTAEYYILATSLASPYSASASYEIGDFIIYNSNTYENEVPISGGEAWNEAHWTQIPTS